MSILSAWQRETAPAERIAVIAACVAWAVGLAFVLSHAIFVTNDSLNNYGHVWYVSDRLWHAHTIPLYMPVLGHGDAFAFPYGFIPWFTAAIFRPLGGDWIVTLWHVLGWAGTVAATFWAFPELRRRFWPAAVLLNPMLVEAVLLGQLPFLWSAALFFAAVACWRQGRVVPAAVLCGLSQFNHPPVMLPIVGLLFLFEAWRVPARRRELFLAYIASLVIAAPAAVIVLLSPSVEDTSLATQFANLIGTDILRFVMIAWPFALVGLAGRLEAANRQTGKRTRSPMAITVVVVTVLVAINLVIIPFRKDQFGWGALTRNVDHTMVPLVTSPIFDKGATYRILRVADGKVGMYQLIYNGARLDAEFFPESFARHSWSDTTAYASFLRGRKVQYVIIYNAYDARYKTNEHELLETLRRAPAVTDDGELCTALIGRNDSSQYSVYKVSVGQCPDLGTKAVPLD